MIDPAQLVVSPYTDIHRDGWEELVRHSGAGTFLHTRRFLSYHGDKFLDRSLVLQDVRGKTIGVFIAAVNPELPDMIVSHPGLTYGGLLHDGSLTGARNIHAFEKVLAYYRHIGVQKLRYKAVPMIYHTMPAQDDLYSLFRLGAVLYRRDLSCAIDLNAPAARTSRRQRNLKKAQSSGLTVTADFARAREYWEILEDNLRSKHRATPTHAIDEMEALQAMFPDNIRLLVALNQQNVVAGAVLFCMKRVVHAQYIASSEAGRQIGALDAVFDRAISDAASNGVRYFDFGISTEQNGMHLNQGLYEFKSEFGCAGVAHDFYELALR